jgi:histone acetyltransferase (RNA polymerase elongator complex component)
LSKSHYIIPIFVPHEGCPHNCVFCNQNIITGSNSIVNADFVNDTIERYLKTINAPDAVVELSFFGGTFTAIDIEKQNELLSVAKKYKDERKIKYIRLSTRPDYIDNNILLNLKNYSVDIIELGIQSMDNEVLIKSGRGHTALDVINASKLIKDYGFTLGHQIMVGLPGDTKEKDIYTVKKIIELSPDMCRIYPALVIKGTPMERMYHENIYKPYSLKECIEICKILYCLLLGNNINVIRIGLQVTEEINSGKDIVAGPFHPAFRELIDSSIINDMIMNEVKAQPKHENIDKLLIELNKKDVSKLFANKKYFFNDMKNSISIQNIKVKENNDIKKGFLKLEFNEYSKILSVSDYIIKGILKNL